MTWGHINLYGEYDFEETANANGERFDTEQIKSFKVGVQQKTIQNSSMKIV